MQCVREPIRSVPDWPAPGVMFRNTTANTTPLLAHPRVQRVLIELFAHRYFDVRRHKSNALAFPGSFRLRRSAR